MTRIARLIRHMHDLLAAHPTATNDRILTHGDIAPWNVIASPEGSLVVIDWDDLGLRPPLWEIAHAAWAFVPLMDRNETDHIGWRDQLLDSGHRLLVFCRAAGVGRNDVSALLGFVTEVCPKASDDDPYGAAASATNLAFVTQHLDSWQRHLRAGLS
jgi:aminoglycoside phosphotransferase (APT) family kinase protein